MTPLLAGLIHHLMMNSGGGGDRPTPQYPTEGGQPIPSNPDDDYQKLVGVLQGLYGGKQGGLAGGGTISNNGAAPGTGPNVGPTKPPPIPPGGAFGNPGSPGQIAYPPGTIANYTLPGHAPQFPQNPIGPQMGGLHPAIAAQLASGVLSSMR